ncbi:peroxiredoxin [Phyllobacterium myrsinacearum]|jgi:peroxiredoxin|uniref:thioredoxin-dependent peroxiredoxin n=1 Tax=Phyllobacterium myrsinacearum TaxID=28101 RepID=A0A2S9JAL4_9HYPH|nr:alkyl hydroperoxide reductase [Phyllobacterium myrsinacearum]PWV83946.1 peroxiredoxin [Phyllobacterium myrsinacearum]RZU96988.1 peroxiredoxin [Phyllobacterium myrsinacearum]
MSEPESLNHTLAQFQSNRAKTMEPQALRINIDQRQLLVDTADRSGFVKAGDKVDAFALKEVGGAELSLRRLLETGPLVLVFFRFEGCPACNIALPYYNAHLAPAVKELGATLVAVSPQVPERLVGIKERHNLDFLVATDFGNDLARKLGILYGYDEPSRQAALAKGTSIGDITGTGTWELPMPATIVIDQTGTVRFADVSPDWLVRTEPENVIQAVRLIRERAAA